ncbi:Carbohydrate-selective porin, OprB family [Planctomycetes bacterium CA13]|uniref:Carbohydrate-selective porin, OprB family n=1 Tax=Novipirellula herctigrandis TaxID=2527986 RepID=A0A5C5Z1U0_9BACT|nr:Carbohydrate-selective porin, OprB family [Planctomycetes bacterium CA13]
MMHRSLFYILLALIVALVSSVPVCAQSSTGPNTQSSSSGQTTTGRLHGLIGERELSNVPDDVGYQLHESDESIDSIFPYGPLTPLNDLWGRSTKRVNESLRLDLGLNYTAVYQTADTSARGPREVSGGDFDFFGRWHLTGREDDWPGSLVFSSETRHRMSSTSPNKLDTGTVGGTIVGFGVQDFSLVQLYWEQGSFEDGLMMRAGKIDPALIYDGGRYVSSNYAFLSPAFADTTPMPLPGAGIGMAGAIYPTDSTYLVAGLHDANGQRTTSGLSTFFDDAEYFSAVELGWFPNENEIDEGSYHITLWHIDARKRVGRRSDQGVALTMEQQVGSDGQFVPFLRYAYADRGLNGIRENLSVGIGLEGPFYQNYDLIGTAFSWQEPSDRGLGNQSVFETFYRFFITPHTHLTPDIQVVIDPSNAPTKSSVTVFGLRIRTLY